MNDIARRSAIALGLGVASGNLRPALAQDALYPTRAVRLLVGFAPGGSLDFVARGVAERLTQRLGQSLKLPRFHGRFAGIDHSFMSIFLASNSMGER